MMKSILSLLFVIAAGGIAHADSSTTSTCIYRTSLSKSEASFTVDRTTDANGKSVRTLTSVLAFDEIYEPLSPKGCNAQYCVHGQIDDLGSTEYDLYPRFRAGTDKLESVKMVSRSHIAILEDVMDHCRDGGLDYEQ